MKTLLILIVLGVVGYFVYEYLIVGEQVLKIKANRTVSTSFSADIDAPSLYPAHHGCIQGTATNISGKVLNNIVLKYTLDGQPVEAGIYRLEPGEQKDFSTQNVKVRSESPNYFMVKMTYE